MAQSFVLCVLSVFAFLTSAYWMIGSDRPMSPPQAQTPAHAEATKATPALAINLGVAHPTATVAAQPPSTRSAFEVGPMGAETRMSAPIAIKSLDVATISARQTADKSKTILVTAIQNELTRVGCLKTEVDGEWGSETQKAMGDFLARANASLPFDRPDHILLTIVKGFPGSACGSICPPGQTRDAANRCWPNAVLAHATKAKATKLAARDAEPRDAAKKPALTRSEKRVPSEKVAAVSLAAAENNRAPQVSRVPLPGRMTLGAPSAQKSEARTSETRTSETRSTASTETKPKVQQNAKRVAEKPQDTAAERKNTSSRKEKVADVPRTSGAPVRAAWTSIVFEGSNTRN